MMGHHEAIEGNALSDVLSSSAGSVNELEQYHITTSNQKNEPKNTQRSTQKSD